MSHADFLLIAVYVMGVSTPNALKGAQALWDRLADWWRYR